jgi:hypothetical protein
MVQITKRKLPAMPAKIKSATGMVIVEMSMVCDTPPKIALSIKVWLLGRASIVGGVLAATSSMTLLMAMALSPVGSMGFPSHVTVEAATIIFV